MRIRITKRDVIHFDDYGRVHEKCVNILKHFEEYHVEYHEGGIRKEDVYYASGKSKSRQVEEYVRKVLGLRGFVRVNIA